jgi:hypothetical protein
MEEFGDGKRVPFVMLLMNSFLEKVRLLGGS